MEPTYRVNGEVKCKQWKKTYIGRKLTQEHVVLTSYSRMTVSLAAQVSEFVSGYTYINFSLQVLSCSVANGFKALHALNKTSNTEETEAFCLNFDIKGF